MNSSSSDSDMPQVTSIRSRVNKTNDPQVILEGKLQSANDREQIVFRMDFQGAEIVCVAGIPPEGETGCPIHIQVKTNELDVGVKSTTQGRLKQGPHSDQIVFRMNWYCVELIFIVAIPPDGETRSPIFVKFKLDWTKNEAPGTKVISG